VSIAGAIRGYSSLPKSSIAKITARGIISLTIASATSTFSGRFFIGFN